MLGGRPGSVPPPLKAAHFVVVDGQLLKPSGAELLPFVVSPPEGIQAIGWTANRKKHASLRCGPCSPLRVEVGTEDGTAAVDVAVARELAEVIAELRVRASQDEILSGVYNPANAYALGPRLYELEDRIASWRGTPVLALLVALVRRPEAPAGEVELELTQGQRDAGRILLLLGNGSPKRDPIEFWKTLLPRRVVAAGQKRTLADAVGWLGEKLSTSPYALAEVVFIMSEMGPEEGEATLNVFRSTPALAVGIARFFAKDPKRANIELPLEAA